MRPRPCVHTAKRPLIYALRTKFWQLRSGRQRSWPNFVPCPTSFCMEELAANYADSDSDAELEDVKLHCGSVEVVSPPWFNLVTNSDAALSYTEFNL